MSKPLDPDYKSRPDFHATAPKGEPLDMKQERKRVEELSRDVVEKRRLEKLERQATKRKQPPTD